MFRIYDKNMNRIPFPDGVIPLDIFISSIARERQTDTIEGMNGVIDYGAVYKERDIKLNLMMQAHDTQDYRLLRDKVYATFDDVVYVAEEYEPGKLYKVRIDAQYIPERINQRVAKAEFECSMPGLPFAESIGTTADIGENGIDSDDKLWAFGMGLIDDDSLQYNHTGTSFKVFNAGNVTVHPFDMPNLKITISSVQGSDDKLELKNKTTGDVFKVSEGVGSDKVIRLDGPDITSNKTAYLRKTNKQYISLAPGWNKFEISGANSAKVEIDTHFYYK